MDQFAPTLRARAGIVLIACVAWLAGASCSREPTTPEAKRQRGDEIVRKMSDHLARARTFAVETTDTRTRAKGGKEITVRTTRRLLVRRPDRLALRVGGDMDLRGWYDGSKLTFVSDPQKVWARVNGAPTIDDTLDRMADRLAMPMPMADFLYSSPYEALIGTKSTGGYVGRETIDGVSCFHVAYTHPAVDWDLWVPDSGDPLPKKLRVTAKTSTRRENDGGHLQQMDVRCRGARRGVRCRGAGGIRACPNRGGQSRDAWIGSLPVGGRRKRAETVAGNSRAGGRDDSNTEIPELDPLRDCGGAERSAGHAGHGGRSWRRRARRDGGAPCRPRRAAPPWAGAARP